MLEIMEWNNVKKKNVHNSTGTFKQTNEQPTNHKEREKNGEQQVLEVYVTLPTAKKGRLKKSTFHTCDTDMVLP